MDYSEGNLVHTSTTLGEHDGIVVEVLVEGDRTMADYIVQIPGLGRVLCGHDEVSDVGDVTTVGDSGDVVIPGDSGDAPNSDGAVNV